MTDMELATLWKFACEVGRIHRTALQQEAADIIEREMIRREEAAETIHESREMWRQSIQNNERTT